MLYGFNLVSIGLPGARTFTSQFLGLNLLVGGSALIFGSLYLLLKASAPAPPPVSTEPIVPRPDVGLELVVEEETPPKPGFYRKIMYVGYFFTFLGLISAVHLIYQVFVRSAYSEVLWWIEVLLVTFGVLSYVIFGSVGRLGMQEEAKLATMEAGAPKGAMLQTTHAVTTSQQQLAPSPQGGLPPMGLTLTEFTRNSAGEYEKHLVGDAYDMFHVGSDTVTVWREDRRGMSVSYLAGPYELRKRMLEERATSGQELAVGILSMTAEAIKSLLVLLKEPADKPTTASVSVQREV